MEAKTRLTEEAYLRGLHEAELVKATDFLSKAKLAAEEQWRAITGGTGGVVQGLLAEVVYVGPDEQGTHSTINVHDRGEGDFEGRGRSLTGPQLQKYKLHPRDTPSGYTP